MIVIIITPGIPTPVSAKALARTIGRKVQDTGMFPSTALNLARVLLSIDMTKKPCEVLCNIRGRWLRCRHSQHDFHSPCSRYITTQRSPSLVTSSQLRCWLNWVSPHRDLAHILLEGYRKGREWWLTSRQRFTGANGMGNELTSAMSGSKKNSLFEQLGFAMILFRYDCSESGGKKIALH
jgi:hypothetical protein